MLDARIDDDRALHARVLRGPAGGMLGTTFEVELEAAGIWPRTRRTHHQSRGNGAPVTGGLAAVVTAIVALSVIEIVLHRKSDIQFWKWVEDTPMLGRADNRKNTVLLTTFTRGRMLSSCEANRTGRSGDFDARRAA